LRSRDRICLARFGQLELHWRACFLLHHCRPRPDPATADAVTDANLDHVATPQLAVNGACARDLEVFWAAGGMTAFLSPTGKSGRLKWALTPDQL